MRRVRSLIGLLVLVACEAPSAPDPGAVAAPLAPPVAASAFEYTVLGAGHAVFGGELRSFSFSARQALDGSATGQFELAARQADVRVHGAVTCARTFGGAAWLGGTITSPGPFQGRDATWRVVDLGEGQKGFPDLISLLQASAPGTAQNWCDFTPFRELFETDGAITVNAPGRTAFTEVSVAPLDGLSVFVPCAAEGVGELVVFEGSLHGLFHFTEDRAGGFHVLSEFNPQNARGVGQTTGDVYRGTGMTGDRATFTISGLPFNFTFVNNFRVIGPGTDNDLVIHANLHVTVNANGDVTAVVENASADCR